MGDSGWRADYSMEVFAREQLAVCEAAGMFAVGEPPIIVGHSFGGFVTILAGRALWRAPRRHRHRRFARQPARPPRRPAQARDQAAQDLSHAPRRPGALPPDAAAELRQSLHRRLGGAHSLKALDGGYTWKFDPAIWQRFSIGDTAQRLKETRCRIAIFRGENSILLPPQIGEYMFNLLGRSAPMVEIPDSQHHVMLDQPLALVAALRPCWPTGTIRSPQGGAETRCPLGAALL